MGVQKPIMVRRPPIAMSRLRADCLFLGEAGGHVEDRSIRTEHENGETPHYRSHGSCNARQSREMFETIPRYLSSPL